MSKLLGSPKSGGRKKGTPNKSSANLFESLEKHKIDIIERLAKILPDLAVEKQADVLLNLMSYIYPKRKAVEMEIAPPEPDKTEEMIITIVNPDKSIKGNYRYDGNGLVPVDEKTEKLK